MKEYYILYWTKEYTRPAKKKTDLYDIFFKSGTDFTCLYSTDPPGVKGDYSEYDLLGEAEWRKSILKKLSIEDAFLLMV